jgi:magnesium chelatase family protein
MNPCPCGYHGDDQKQCMCSPLAVQRYQQRISGPLLDRIDELGAGDKGGAGGGEK